MEPQFYVEIVRRADGFVEKRMGPMNYEKSERVERGALINLNRDEWFVRVVSSEREARHD